ncbi:hypothetical protein [Cohnella rhizosphaerae]|uniref:Uncharacterized protein n=1 Tax=Cohnella rhizosphaerae TaxID=1457232 RepID=A0A9X4KWY3_9BACL|nr:hypothetical protein [Cohnella rhizosphaerae]MDG0812313.1 hypothetical protein [Cohnella rhizosphaerae]
MIRSATRRSRRRGASPDAVAGGPHAGDRVGERPEAASDDDFLGDAAVAGLEREASQSRAWDAKPPVLSLKLYPGAERVPSGWLRQPAAYHVSTRKEIVERAIAWRAGLRLSRKSGWIDFAPERVMPADTGGWRVWGRPFVREAVSCRPALAEHPVALEAAEIGALMILLPEAARIDASRPIT